MKSNRSRFWSSFLLLLLLLALGLNACNMPRRGATTPVTGAPAIYTAAAQTVQAQLTQVNQPPGATFTGTTPQPPLQTTAPASVDRATSPAPDATTPAPGETETANCNQARFVKDVSVPDNTEFSPDQSFEKTWRLENSGVCAWTTGYSLVFTGGDALDAPASVPLPDTPVQPGDTVDVTVPMKAPNTSGSYLGEWKLRTPDNAIFGVGDESKPVWVKINVVVASGLVYDFIARASSADWKSGTGNDVNKAITFGGDQLTQDGLATIFDRVLLETGATSGKILVTHPAVAKDGAIAGIFPEYTVQPGDHFKVRLGFMLLDGVCDGGDAVFGFGYFEDGQQRDLETWRETCDGRFENVDMDLSSLAGKTVRFVLSLQANGSPNGDWGVWNSALIEH